MPITAQLPLVTTVALTALTAVLLLSDPVLGRRQYREFRAEVALRGEDARRRHYRRWIRQGWVWAAVVVLAVLALPGVDLADLGLRAPDLDRFLAGRGLDVTPSTIAGMLTGIALGTAAIAVATRKAARARDAGRTVPVPVAGAAAIAPMLPPPAGAAGAGRGSPSPPASRRRSPTAASSSSRSPRWSRPCTPPRSSSWRP